MHTGPRHGPIYPSPPKRETQRHHIHPCPKKREIRRTSRTRRTLHPSNPLPASEQCDNLCDSMRLYMLIGLFVSVVKYTTQGQTHIRKHEPNPSPKKHQTLRDTNQFILQIIRRHPQINDELDRASARFIIWRKHRDKYEKVAVHCCSVSATTSPWLAAPFSAWAAAPRTAWPVAALPSWAVAPPDILQSRRAGDAHVRIY